MPPRPVQQILEEVQERFVRPLQILEDEDCRRLLRQTFEEDAPRGEEVS
jgi:hypothetical protein